MDPDPISWSASADRRGHDHPGLGQAVRLDPGHAPPVDQLLVQRGRDADMDGQPHLVRAVRLARGCLEQQAGRGRDAEQHGHVVLAHHRPVARDAEPAHGHHRGARLQREQQHPRRIVVEELEAADHPVGGSNAVQLLHQVGEPDPVVVPYRTALRRPGCAGGVEDVGEVATRPGRPVRPSGPGVAAQAARLAGRGDDDLRQLRAVGLKRPEQVRVRRVHDGDPGRRVTQHVPGVVTAGRGIQRHQDAAAGGHRHPGDHELGPVRHHDGDPVAGPDAGARGSPRTTRSRPRAGPG